MSDETKRLLWEQLVRDEGLRLTAYKDSVGLWTIGVGHLLGSKRMLEVTLSEAKALFWSDIAEAEAVAVKCFGAIDLDSPRGRAFVNMAFNLGNRLAQFKRLAAAVQAQDWLAAGVAMADSKWARQVGDRAVRLRRVVETGAET